MEYELIPFDLAKWQADPSIQIVYRNGEKPQEIHYFKTTSPDYPVVSIDKNGDLQRHGTDGFYYSTLDHNGYDLLIKAPIEIITFYANVYSDYIRAFGTLAQAVKVRNDAALGTIEMKFNKKSNKLISVTICE